VEQLGKFKIEFVRLAKRHAKRKIPMAGKALQERAQSRGRL
jgi:hypothetical protein